MPFLFGMAGGRPGGARPGSGGGDGGLVVGVDDACAGRAAERAPARCGDARLASRWRAAGDAQRERARAARIAPAELRWGGRLRALYMCTCAPRPCGPPNGPPGVRKAAGAAARLPHQLLYVRQQCASGRNEYILLQTCAGLVYKVGAQSMARPLRTQITQFMRTRAVYTATCMLSHADRTSKCPQNMRNLQRYKVRAAAALSIRRRHTCCARAAVSAMAAPHAASQRIDERAEISQHRCCGGAGGRLASKT